MIAHLGQQQFCAALQHVLDELLLRFNQLVNTILNGATTDELMHQDIALLPNTIGAIGRLVFDSRIPPSIEMDHVRGRSQIESRAAGLELQHEKRHQLVLLKPRDQGAAFGHRGATMQYQAVATEDRTQKSRQRRGGFAKLGEQ